MLYKHAEYFHHRGKRMTFIFASLIDQLVEQG